MNQQVTSDSWSVLLLEEVIAPGSPAWIVRGRARFPSFPPKIKLARVRYERIMLERVSFGY